jgi:hypothetical protein
MYFYMLENRGGEIMPNMIIQKYYNFDDEDVVTLRERSSDSFVQ